MLLNKVVSFSAAAIMAVSSYAADLTLAWDYTPTSPIIGFRLQVKPKGGQWTLIDGAISPNVRQYKHQDVPLDILLLYKLSAFDAEGESLADYVWGSAQTEPSAPPASPNTVTVTVSMP